jgi:hypothetical protein
VSSSAPARRDEGSHEVSHDEQGDDHGHALAPVVVNGVSSDQEPSVEWGWHGHYPKVAQFAGFAVAAICLIMIHGNHVGKQEDIWLVVIAIAFASLSIGNIVRQRSSWRR